MAQGEMTMEIMTVTEQVDAESQALVYAQQVATGTKLAASFMVKPELVDAVAKTILAEGCRFVVDSDGRWATIWVYKYPFVELLIEEKRAGKEHGRPSPLEIWSTGKLFGYSDYEIARFLEQHEYIDSALT